MMPRVVANQRERFDNDELFRKLSRDMEASLHKTSSSVVGTLNISLLICLYTDMLWTLSKK